MSITDAVSDCGVCDGGVLEWKGEPNRARVRNMLRNGTLADLIAHRPTGDRAAVRKIPVPERQRSVVGIMLLLDAKVCLRRPTQ